MINKDILNPLKEVYEKYPKWEHETNLQYHERLCFLFYNNMKILELEINIRDRKELLALQAKEKSQKDIKEENVKCPFTGDCFIYHENKCDLMENALQCGHAKKKYGDRFLGLSTKDIELIELEKESEKNG